MSRLVNLYCHGYVATPIIECLRVRHVFALLDNGRGRQWSRLIKLSKANAGYFTMALEALESWGWLSREEDSFRLTDRAEVNRFALNLSALYATEPREWLLNETQSEAVSDRIDAFIQQSPHNAGSSSFAAGGLILPLVHALKELSALPGLTECEPGWRGFELEHPRIADAVGRLFVKESLLTDDRARLTSDGALLIQAQEWPLVIAQREFLARMNEVLFGDAAAVFAVCKPRFDVTAGMGGEPWRDLHEAVVEIFNHQPFVDQPQVIVDPSGGAKVLLEDLHRTVMERTERGRVLGQLPLRLVSSTGGSLDGSGDGAGALQVRAFIDQSFPVSASTLPNPALAILSAGQVRRHLDGQGGVLPFLNVLSAWQRHLQGLTASRMLILLTHSAGADLERAWESSEYFDGGLRALSHEISISAESFIIVAASVGLFNDAPVKRYPALLSPCRATLHHLCKRDYTVRHAHVEDLDSLERLEELCWAHTRSSRERIRCRLEEYPQGQFVLEKNGVALGVIYSQRILTPDDLKGRCATDVHELHRPAGSVVQLLAVNIHPDVQNLGYGDQLLEFMLQRCSLMDGVDRVVGVTICKNFGADSELPFEHYIHLRGSRQDPVLAFHQAHGAEIVEPIAGYRPADLANQAHGVLVSYDIRRRVPRDQRIKMATKEVTEPLPAWTSEQIGRFVHDQVRRLLGQEIDGFDADRPLMEMGLDSADLLKLQQQFEETFARKFRTGFFFEHHSVNKVIRHLMAHRTEVPLLKPAPPAAVLTRSEPAESQPVPMSSDVAVVGMSCKLPGGIENPEDFWRVLVAEGSMIGTFPEARGSWPSNTDRPGLEYGGFVQDGDAFDAAFFRISPAEAELTDPQQRILLQLAWACLEDASRIPADLKGSNTGVFIGASNCDYSRLIQASGLETQAHQATGSSLAVLANRLSYFFDLSGPSLLIDTACSSSLVALHTAVQYLHAGECDLALVGGINFICHSDLSVAYHKAGMLAADGRCKVFDARANGYVRAEGAVVMLLKPLAKALAEHDHIHAVIKGSAINHGGLAGGLTVPNPQKQSELLLAAWKDAAVRPRDLSYIEAHGTGTSLGDPIEIQGVQSAFNQAEAGAPATPCAIGSVKSNLGHLESAAGLTGLLKVILSMKHRELPASINFSNLNPKISFADTLLSVADTRRPWKVAFPRLAGVSSFGSGGANAHVVVQEHRAAAPTLRSEQEHLFVLSAANHERLQQYVREVLAWLESHSDGNFADAIYSWQIGRTSMKQRIALKVTGHADLQLKLKQWLGGAVDSDLWSSEVNPAGSSIYRLCKSRSGQKLVEQVLEARDLEQLGLIWTAGIDIDWRLFYAAGGRKERLPQRISLPTYPFAKERYWIDVSAAKPGAQSAVSALLHPLLHTNTSDLFQQSYRSSFSGEEFFLADHRVKKPAEAAQRVLPAVAYLEMARAAIEKAMPRQEPGRELELRNVVWAQPIVVSGETSVGISLSVGDEEEIEYEVYSEEEGGEERIHCQGRAEFGASVSREPVPLAQLQGQMSRGRLEPKGVYEAFTRIGLVYGPSFQSIEELHLGDGQLLAKLKVPSAAGLKDDRYGLHPSVMDGALQASIGLLGALSGESVQARLPFALESLRVVSACTGTMWAWVRYAPGSRADDAVTKLDIDLSDEHGAVCVEMRGFSSRLLSKESAGAWTPVAATPATLLATAQWRAGSAARVAVSYAQRQVLVCETGDGSQLQGLLPGSRCVGLGTVSDASRQGSLAERYERCAVQCFEQVRGILQSKVSGPVLVQVVVRVSGAEGAVFAGLAGLLKTAALENPQIHGQLILSESPVAQLALELEEDRGYAQDVIVRHAGGQREVLGWQVQEPSKSQAPIAFKDGGVYLITGGLGGLGRVFAREIFAQTSQARVIVTGRGELDEGKQRLLKELESLGAVQYRSVELGDARQVRGLVAGLVSEHGQLNGIVHSAGMIADNFILKKSAAEFAQVLGPKVHGTYALDEASATVELDFLVLFSSVAGALGNVGQADYAAGNGFMDGFAAYRNERVTRGERHGRTLSINWPLWEAGGMRIEASTQALLEQSTGLKPLATAAGLEAFYQSLALTGDQALVLYGAAGRLLDALEPRVRATPPTSATAPTAAPAPMPAAIESSDLLERTQDYLRKQLSQLLKLPAHQIDSQAPLEQYGIDSILAMNLTNQLEKTFGSLSKTLFFEYRTVRELSQYFIRSFAGQLLALFTVATLDRTVATERIAAKDSPLPEPTSLIAGSRFARHSGKAKRSAAIQIPLQSHSSMSADAIAIVGLSGRYPESANIDVYWNNLRAGKDCIVEVPAERWDWHEYFSADRTKEGRHYSKWGGFIEGVDEFDPLFFNISPREAKSIDPQERLFLQHAWMAIEDAGYTRARLQIPDQHDLPGQVGVYVGVMYSEYQLAISEAGVLSQRLGFAGSLASSIANRVSYVFDLHGPSMTLDTMCSSSLTAIHLACQDLRLGRTSLAIAGGVNVSIHPNKYLMLSAGQFISSEGQCQSFGEGGDGYIPGEGVGAVVLKRLSEAERNGDHIYGIIRGSALSHGGKTNGYTVPNPQAQTSAINRALSEARVDARHISYIEAHGTGTKLGDPIEIAALAQAFHQHTEERGFCALGSAKSNIGHCESAAGIAGLTKILLQMRHQQIVPSLHSARLNPHIDFAKTPFVVNQTLRAWERPVIEGRTIARIAGISSFGAGGSNAHMLIEEYRAPVQASRSVPGFEHAGGVIIVLSARTPEQLQHKARDLLEFIGSPAGQGVELVSMAYTLQVGREAMEERLGLLVLSIEQLQEKLGAYVGGERALEDVYQGQVKRNQEGMILISQDDDMKDAIDRWMARKKLTKLLDLWVKGLELDWEKLYGQSKPQRISLPTYPFAKERYWIDVSAAKPGAQSAVSALLHPLLHTNTSDLFQQSYRSSFSGEEFFLADHRVKKPAEAAQRVLPAVAYLEMARAAIESTTPVPPGKELQLLNVVWAQPIVVGGAKQVGISLLLGDEEQVEYEVYAEEEGEESIHCQGRAVFMTRPERVMLSLDVLKAGMARNRFSPREVYGAFTRMGLLYGPSFQSIEELHLGDGQLLAKLKVPSAAGLKDDRYGLHPSVMDGALQASIGLLGALSGESVQARLPFALESLRVVSACTGTMWAWVRYAPGSRADDAVTKLDIDLSDEHGAVCVEMRGFSSRLLSKESAGAWTPVAATSATLLATAQWRAGSAARVAVSYAQRQVLVCETGDGSQLQGLLPGSRCVGLGTVSDASRQGSLAERYERCAVQCFEQVRGILQSKVSGPVLVQVVVRVSGAEGAVFAGLAGLLKTAALENPQIHGQLILSESPVAQLALELEEDRGYAQDVIVRHAGGQREVLGWQVQEPSKSQAPIAFKDGGVYLITGGLGDWAGCSPARSLRKRVRRG